MRKYFRYVENVADRPAESSRGAEVRSANTRGPADREFVGGLARGLAVIECFGTDAPELTLSEVAARTGLTPATARRALLTLEALGREPTDDERTALIDYVHAHGLANLARLLFNTNEFAFAD